MLHGACSPIIETTPIIGPAIATSSSPITPNKVVEPNCLLPAVTGAVYAGPLTVTLRSWMRPSAIE